MVKRSRRLLCRCRGGATAVYSSSGLSYYRHADWLGSSRFASTPNRAMYFDVAYAPFGEPYAQSGSSDLSFTGQNQDTAGGLYDFAAREYSIQGRWPSPDPAGLRAVDLSDPQSFNRYAYVTNRPTTLVDPQGLKFFAGQTGGGGGGLFLLAGFFFVDMFAGSGYGGYTLDGIPMSSGLVQGLLATGAAVQCSNNDCTGFNGASSQGNTSNSGSNSTQASANSGGQQASEPVGCVTVVDSASGTTSRSCDSGGPARTGANNGSVAQQFLEGVVDGAFNIASDYFYVISFGQLAPKHPVDLSAGTPVYQVGGAIGEEIGVAAGGEVSELSGAADAITEAGPVATGAAADCARNFAAAYSPTPGKPSTILGMACYGAGVLLNQLGIP